MGKSVQAITDRNLNFPTPRSFQLNFPTVIFRTNTELWKTDGNWNIVPTLSKDYSYGGLFLVDVGFCRKN